MIQLHRASAALPTCSIDPQRDTVKEDLHATGVLVARAHSGRTFCRTTAWSESNRGWQVWAEPPNYDDYGETK